MIDIKQEIQDEPQILGNSNSQIKDNYFESVFHYQVVQALKRMGLEACIIQGIDVTKAIRKTKDKGREKRSNVVKFVEELNTYELEVMDYLNINEIDPFVLKQCCHLHTEYSKIVEENKLKHIALKEQQIELIANGNIKKEIKDFFVKVRKTKQTIF